MDKIRIAIIAVVILIGQLACAHTTSFARSDIFFYPDPPRLRYPIYDKVDLTAETSLEFKWWNTQINTINFEFRLYKGYNMYEDGLISKQTLHPSTDSIKLSADLFQDGQVYTWSLIRIDFSGKKSDRSFNSFTVIKKAGK